MGMKSIMRYLLLLGVVTFFMSSCAGKSGYMKPADSLLSPPEDKAVVRFMRPSGMGPIINFNIWDGEKVIGNAVAKSQFDYLADPGKHLFVAVAEHLAFLDAELEAGKTYYVFTRIYGGNWKARVAFLPVTRDSEFWDRMNLYENKLIKLKPDMGELKQWEEANKYGIEYFLERYNREWENSNDWPKLNPEDGR